MKTALLIIDIQNDYFENGAMPLYGAFQAAENTQLILSKFRKDSNDIVHIQHIATRPSATFFLPQTEGADIYSSVKPADQEKVIIKHFPNSFIDTDLQHYLQSNEITDLVICGMMSHLCIDATVRAAKDLGYHITLIEDACATKDLQIGNQKISAENVHYSFMAALSYYYASVISTKEFLKLHQNE